MTDDTTLIAVHGAPHAQCAVCLGRTLRRLVLGDGFVPICSISCLQVWPRVRALLAEVEKLTSERDEARRIAAMWRDWCRATSLSEPGGLPWEEKPWEEKP